MRYPHPNLMTSLTLQLPNHLYESLKKAANKAGTSPEAIATQWLETTMNNLDDDPIEEFIGSIHSEIPDWGENHDRYLGKQFLSQHDE